MNDLQYKCPGCGAPITFDPTTQAMTCKFCGEKTDVSAAERLLTPKSQASDDVWQTAPETNFDAGAQQTMAQFTCPSCGGGIVGSPDLVSTRCPYCDNNFVAQTQLTSTRVPDRMIPFALNKQQMIESFQRQTQGLRFLPNDFRSSHSLDEARGVYLPYWLYDADIVANFVYTGEKKTVWTDAGTEYTQTDHYELYRAGYASFDDIPVLATTDITPAQAEGIEPFDYKAMQPFATAFLAGYSANKFNVQPEVANARANERIKGSAKRLFAVTGAEFSNVQTKSEDVQFANGVVEYVFLPTYLLNLRYAGQRYPFVINGQTGKVAGAFPISKAKVWGFFAGVGLAITAALSFPAIYALSRLWS